MQGILWQWAAIAVVGIGLGAQAVRAGEPVMGVDVGAAIPISKFKQTAKVGGAVAPFIGYQFGDTFALTLIAQPQLAAFQTCKDAKNCPSAANPESDITSLFSFTAGPRFSLNDEGKEIFFSAQGGVYHDLTGPLNETAGGYSIAGGFNYDLKPGTALGLYVRRDQASMDATPGLSDDVEFLTAGLSLRHRFLPPAPVVAQAPPPPAPEPPAPAPPAKKKIVLRGVHFDFDKAVIRDDAGPILDEAIATLKEYGTITIAVEGHTDGVGSDEYNQGLSLRRATAVRDYLEAGGVESGRMTAEGFGESKPVAANDTGEGRAQNRRVELRVTSEE